MKFVDWLLNRSTVETVRYLGDMQKLTFGPDDVLIMQSDEHIDSKVATQVRQLLEDKFPGHRVLVLSKGWRVGVIAETDAPRTVTTAR